MIVSRLSDRQIEAEILRIEAEMAISTTFTPRSLDSNLYLEQLHSEREDRTVVKFGLMECCYGGWD